MDGSQRERTLRAGGGCAVTESFGFGGEGVKPRRHEHGQRCFRSLSRAPAVRAGAPLFEIVRTAKDEGSRESSNFALWKGIAEQQAGKVVRRPKDRKKGIAYRRRRLRISARALGAR